MKAYRRKFTRIKYKQTVQLKTADGLALIARSENISVEGLEIVCDQLSAKAISPSAYRPDPEKPLLLSAELSLDDTGNTMKTVCCLKNVRRLSQDTFNLHLKFTVLKSQSLRLLEELFSKQIN
ncbi:MAG: PilZ domain-containing protein [Cycloclasticus sp.]|nr:PilZ domain-containing protein [Cycloclasticus sp.]